MNPLSSRSSTFRPANHQGSKPLKAVKAVHQEGFLSSSKKNQAQLLDASSPKKSEIVKASGSWLWPLGHLPVLRRNFFDTIQKYHQQCGDLFSLNIGPFPYWFIFDTAKQQTILKKGDNRSFARVDPASKMLKPVFGNSILGVDGSLWADLRIKHAPLVNNQSLAMYNRFVPQHLSELFQAWPDGQSVNISESVSSFSFYLTVRIIYGLNTTGALAMQHATFGLELSIQEMVEDGFNLFAGIKTRYYVEKIKDIVVPLIEKRRRLVDRNAEEFYMMSFFLNDENTFSKEAIHDAMLSLTLASSSTTAKTMIWALAVLAHYPYEKLLLEEEIKAYLKNKHHRLGDPLSYGQIKELPRMKQFFKEVLRTYPIVWMYSRQCINSQGFDADGLHIPYGTNIFLSPYAANNDPNIFEDPQVFDSNRWNEPTNESEKLLHQQKEKAWMSFGAGAHHCLGRHLAEMIFIHSLFQIISQYDFQPVAETFPDVRSKMFLEPTTPIELRMHRRSLQ